jgi:hypothetical protein
MLEGVIAVDSSAQTRRELGRAPPSATTTPILTPRSPAPRARRPQASAYERDAAKLRAAVAAAEGSLEVVATKRADVLEEAAVEQVGPAERVPGRMVPHTGLTHARLSRKAIHVLLLTSRWG